DRPLAQVPRGEKEQDGAPAQARMSARPRRAAPPTAVAALLLAAALRSPAAFAQTPPPPPAPCTAEPSAPAPCVETPADAVAVVAGRPVRPEDLDAKAREAADRLPEDL